MSFKLIQNIPPAAEPVELEDVKAHLRVDSDYDDDLIEGLICAARVHAEQFTQRSFVTQSWYYYLDRKHHDRFLPPLLRDRNPERDKIRLPKGPIQSVDSFEYQCPAGTWNAIDPSLYYIDLPGEQVVLTPRDGTISNGTQVTFPRPAVNESGYRIGYTAGWGTMPDIVDRANPNPLPPTIPLAIKTFVLHFYENREAFAAGKLDAVPAAGESLLMPHRAMDY